MKLDLEQQINTLLGDFTALAPRIKHLTFNTDQCGDRIDIRCSYIPFRDGTPTFNEFIDTVYDHIIPFCLPRSEIRQAQSALANGDHVAAGRIVMQLSEKARTLFIKAKKGSSRSGEAGEIVLYILTEWLLQAPQIVSKMYLKTNNQMPVHGTDGIHARYDNKTNRLYLYWGESKAHVKIASALSSALASVKEFIDDGQDKREIEIVSTYSDFDNLDPDSKEAFLRYLDPYSEESNERVETHSCLLVFEYHMPTGVSSNNAEKKFITTTKSTVEDFIASIKKTVEDKGLAPQRFEFFLLPVPSVQDFRDKFQQRLGWPND
jgi:hypothetical protein